jgi:hypothetical protein
VACCVLACGDRPDLPGPATPNGAGSASSGQGSGGQVTVLGAQPVLPTPTPTPAPPSDEPSAPDAAAPAALPGDELPPGEPEPVGPAEATVLACTVNRQGCVTLFIAATASEADSCVQLTLDDCGDTTRPGLAVDVPLAWRFGSGFVSALGDTCVPRTPFVVNNATIVSATGSIDWNQDTRQPSEIVIDVTLQPSSSEAAGTPAPIAIASRDLVEPLLECDD